MPHDSYLSNLAQFGDKGVQVFFILSGFVIPYSLCRRSLSDFSPPRFLLRRMTRIHPPYLLAVVLAMATYGLVLGRPGFFDPKVVASNFLYLPAFLPPCGKTLPELVSKTGFRLKNFRKAVNAGPQFF